MAPLGLTDARNATGSIDVQGQSWKLKKGFPTKAWPGVSLKATAAKVSSFPETNELMKVGDRVRLIGVPPGLEDELEELTYRHCLGHEFLVAAINQIGYAETEVDFITGASGDKLHVPPAFLEIVSP